MLVAKKLKEENSLFNTGGINESINIKLAEKFSLLGSSGLEEALKIFKELNNKNIFTLDMHKALISALCMAFKADRIKLAIDFFELIDNKFLKKDSTHTQQSFEFIFDSLLKGKNSKEKLEQGYSIVKKIHDTLVTKCSDKIANELFSISPKLAIQWTIDNNMTDSDWLKKLVMDSSVCSEELIEYCLALISNEVYPAIQMVFIIKKALFHRKNMGIQTRLVEIFIPHYNEIEKEDLFSMAQTSIFLIKNKKKISCLEEIISACIKKIDHNTTKEDKNIINELVLFSSKNNSTLSIEYLKHLILFKKFIPQDMKITEETVRHLSLSEFRLLISSYPKEKYDEVYKYFQWAIKWDSFLELEDFQSLMSISIHLFNGVLKTSNTDFAHHPYWKSILDVFKKIQDTFEKINSKKTILIDKFQPDFSLIVKQFNTVHMDEEKFLGNISKSQIITEFSNVLKLLEEEKFLDKLLKNQVNFVADLLILIHHSLFTSISYNKEFTCIENIEENRKILLSYALKQNKGILNHLVNKIENQFFYDHIDLIIELANKNNSFLSIAVSFLKNDKSDEGYIYRILKKNKIHQQLNEEELLNNLNKQKKESINVVFKIDSLLFDLTDIDYNKFIRILFLLQNFRKDSTSKILLSHNQQQIETLTLHLESILKNFELEVKIEAIRNFLQAVTSFSDKSLVIKIFSILIDQLIKENSFFYLAPDKLFNIVIAHYDLHLYEQSIIETVERKKMIKLSSEAFYNLIQLGLATKEDDSSFFIFLIEEFEMIKNSIEKFYNPLAKRFLNSRSEFICTLTFSYQIKFYTCLAYLVLEFDKIKALHVDLLFRYHIKINHTSLDKLLLISSDFYQQIEMMEKKCQQYLVTAFENINGMLDREKILYLLIKIIESENKIEKLNLRALEKSFFFICSILNQLLVQEKNQKVTKNHLFIVFKICKQLENFFSEKGASKFLLHLWLKLLHNCKELTLSKEDAKQYIEKLSNISSHFVNVQILDPLKSAFNLLDNFYIQSKIPFIYFISFAYKLYQGFLNIELNKIELTTTELSKNNSLASICLYKKNILDKILSNCKNQEDYLLFYNILPTIISRTMNRFFEHSFTLCYKRVEANNAYVAYHLNLVKCDSQITLDQKIEELDTNLEKEKRSQLYTFSKYFHDIFQDLANKLNKYFKDQNSFDKVTKYYDKIKIASHL